MKLKYLLASCLIGAGLFSSCADEFKDLNSKESDISTPNVRFLFAECLNKFEPMEYMAWYYDMPRLGQWSQCVVSPSGNGDNFNLITEQGSIGGHVYQMLRMVNDLRYQISLMSEEDKAKNEYIQYLCNPLLVFVSMNDSDLYGSRQYSEAEMARYTNPPIFLPKYDTQEELVEIWLKELDETINYLTTKNISDVLGSQDFIYNGDLTKWAKLANSLKLKIAARLINTNLDKALTIANQAISSPAGLLDDANDGDLIYNRGKNSNHWNNDFPHGVGHDLLIDFLKANKDTRLLSAFTKNEFNGAVVQAFLDQEKELPPYIAENAIIEDGVISANLEEQPMPETEIVLDTSGSINETLLKNFLRECKNILQHSRLKVGCFDTEFYGFHEIRTEEDIENMRFEGGGGTNFDVAVGAFSRRVENKIIFTDGDAYMPNKPLDAIWIVFGRIRINPKGGKVIQIDGEQLERLYSYQQDSSYKGRSR